MKTNESDKTPDEQWDIVKEYYERCYKVKFTARPSPENVQMLYRKIKMLADDFLYYEWKRLSASPRKTETESP